MDRFTSKSNLKVSVLAAHSMGIDLMIEFESKDAANILYQSEEDQAAKAISEKCSKTALIIIEGLAY